MPVLARARRNQLCSFLSACIQERVWAQRRRKVCSLAKESGSMAAGGGRGQILPRRPPSHCVLGSWPGTWLGVCTNTWIWVQKRSRGRGLHRSSAHQAPAHCHAASKAPALSPRSPAKPQAPAGEIPTPAAVSLTAHGTFPTATTGLRSPARLAPGWLFLPRWPWGPCLPPMLSSSSSSVLGRPFGPCCRKH